MRNPDKPWPMGDSEDSYRTALDECINSGWEFCGGSDEDGTHLTILRRCIC